MPKTPRISEAEWVVMRLLWEKAPRTANEVVEAIADAQQWQAGTVKTLLGRLVRKGALKYRAEGRTYFYSPAVSEQNCVRAESRSFVDRVFGGALTPMLAEFIESAPLSQAEIDELKRLLEKKAGQR